MNVMLREICRDKFAAMVLVKLRLAFGSKVLSILENGPTVDSGKTEPLTLSVLGCECVACTAYCLCGEFEHERQRPSSSMRQSMVVLVSTSFHGEVAVRDQPRLRSLTGSNNADTKALRREFDSPKTR